MYDSEQASFISSPHDILMRTKGKVCITFICFEILKLVYNTDRIICTRVHFSWSKTNTACKPSCASEAKRTASRPLKLAQNSHSTARDIRGSPWDTRISYTYWKSRRTSRGARLCARACTNAHDESFTNLRYRCWRLLADGFCCTLLHTWRKYRSPTFFSSCSFLLHSSSEIISYRGGAGKSALESVVPGKKKVLWTSAFSLTDHRQLQSSNFAYLK